MKNPHRCTHILFMLSFTELWNITFLLETRQTTLSYTCNSYIKPFLKILALCSKPFQFKSVSLFSPQQKENSKKTNMDIHP